MLPIRRHEITRLEAFSDAVFAFALTLLVVSLEVPRDYRQLMVLMNGFLPFACCFAMLVWIWHEHNMYFRRYGLQDSYTVFINAILLFVVLFYVYPLKFMFDSMFAQFLPTLRLSVVQMTFPELARASAIYGLGFVVLFLLFALLYRHAYRKRADSRADAARGVRRQVVRRPSPRERRGRRRGTGRGARAARAVRFPVADVLRPDGPRTLGVRHHARSSTQTVPSRNWPFPPECRATPRSSGSGRSFAISKRRDG